MIVVDSSAVIAMIFGEASASQLHEALVASPRRIMSPANVLECALRLSPRLTDDRTSEIDVFLANYEIGIPPIDVAQLAFARAGFLAYGKGRHPAGLNFGDCFAYSLAKQMDAPLLFVGGDFAKTDVRIALGPL